MYRQTRGVDAGQHLYGRPVHPNWGGHPRAPIPAGYPAPGAPAGAEPAPVRRAPSGPWVWLLVIALPVAAGIAVGLGFHQLVIVIPLVFAGLAAVLNRDASLGILGGRGLVVLMALLTQGAALLVLFLH